ncbi:hypothetical protein [Streptomyces sp. NPDC001774]
MARSRRCKKCGVTRNPNGTPTLIVAVRGEEDVYACAEHQRQLRAPKGDPLVAIAQLQDMARRR